MYYEYRAIGSGKEQLQAEKNFLISNFPFIISHNRILLQSLITIGYYRLPFNDLDTYREKIKSVTREQVKKAINRAVQLNRLVVVNVGGKAK